MGRWNRYWYGPVAAVRPFVVQKAVLLLFAFDAWTRSMRTAARYGLGGFNIAHFSWMDALQPLPTAGVRTGTLIASGLMAMTVVCGGGGRWLLLALTAIHTYSWSMSMLDSFQHHYFLSLTFLCLAFFPAPGVRDLAGPDTARSGDSRATGPLTSAWAYVLLGVNVAIVYAYAAIPKMEYDWRSGETFHSIKGTQLLDPLADLGVRLGISQGWFWRVTASSVIVLELMLAAGYLLAVRQDAMPRRRAWLVGATAWTLALLLHVGAEVIDLRIGWFSYYMLAIACGFLLPRSWIEGLVHIVLWLPDRARRALVGWQHTVPASARPVVTAGLTFGVLCATVFVGRLLDLPGAVTACTALGIALAAGTLVIGWRSDHLAAQRYALAAITATGILWGAITHGTLRYDYYRFLAHDLAARDALRPALAAYVKADRYAPPGESRQEKIEELRKKIGADE